MADGLGCYLPRKTRCQILASRQEPGPPNDPITAKTHVSDVTQLISVEGFPMRDEPNLKPSRASRTDFYVYRASSRNNLQALIAIVYFEAYSLCSLDKVARSFPS